jgi:hypothetical protein
MSYFSWMCCYYWPISLSLLLENTHNQQQVVFSPTTLEVDYLSQRTSRTSKRTPRRAKDTVHRDRSLSPRPTSGFGILQPSQTNERPTRLWNITSSHQIQPTGSPDRSLDSTTGFSQVARYPKSYFDVNFHPQEGSGQAPVVVDSDTYHPTELGPPGVRHYVRTSPDRVSKRPCTCSCKQTRERALLRTSRPAVRMDNQNQLERLNFDRTFPHSTSYSQFQNGRHEQSLLHGFGVRAENTALELGSSNAPPLDRYSGIGFHPSPLSQQPTSANSQNSFQLATETNSLNQYSAIDSKVAKESTTATQYPFLTSHSMGTPAPKQLDMGAEGIDSSHLAFFHDDGSIPYEIDFSMPQ